MYNNESSAFEGGFTGRLQELEVDEFGNYESPAINKLASAYGLQGGGDVSYDSLMAKLAGSGGFTGDSMGRRLGFKGNPITNVKGGLRAMRVGKANMAKRNPGTAVHERAKALRSQGMKRLVGPGVMAAGALGLGGYAAYRALRKKKDSDD